MKIFLAVLLSLLVGGNAWSQEQKIRLTPARENLPDPSVLLDKGTFYLTGTGGGVVPLYRSSNGVDFKFIKNFNPSTLDSTYSYCNIWAPDLERLPNGRYLLTFSAGRFNKKNGKCGDTEVTTFVTSAPDNGFNFLAPWLKNTKGPKSATHYGCDGFSDCQKTIRIDAKNFIDPVSGKRQFFYTWFHKGNNISSFAEDDPTKIIHHASASSSYEERVNEAPDVFKRGKYYYLIYSVGSFDRSYGLDYVYAETLAGLTKARGVRRLLEPTFNPRIHGCSGYTGQRIAKAAGHSSTVKTADGYYLYFHRNKYKSPLGCHELVSRSVYRQKLTFLADGSIVPLKQAYLSWENLGPGYVYSLDIKLKSGEIIAPCLSSQSLDRRTQLLFAGRCLNTSRNDSSSSEYFNPFNVITSSRENVALCNNEFSISPYRRGSSERYCPNVSAAGYDLSQVASARICSSYNGDWADTGICSPFQELKLGTGNTLKLPSPR